MITPSHEARRRNNQRLKNCMPFYGNSRLNRVMFVMVIQDLKFVAKCLVELSKKEVLRKCEITLTCVEAGSECIFELFVKD
jgi:hypothetical protein